MRMLLEAQARNQAISGLEPGMSHQAVFDRNWKKCYAVDNNFAYKKDLFDAEPTQHNKIRMEADVRMYNFAPTVDRWCLWCERKEVKRICSKCHHVFFCDTECQRRAWGRHKVHCGRDVFAICITCAEPTTGAVKCDKCPVTWCSDACKAQLVSAHNDFDCANFVKLFGSNLKK